MLSISDVIRSESYKPVVPPSDSSDALSTLCFPAFVHFYGPIQMIQNMISMITVTQTKMKYDNHMHMICSDYSFLFTYQI